jgi:short-subunit dehydrogenase
MKPVTLITGASSGLAAASGEYWISSLSARRVAELGYRGFIRGRRVVVAGLGTKIAVWLVRAVPNAVLLPVVGHRMRDRRDNLQQTR